MKIAINAVAALQGGGVTYLNQILRVWGSLDHLQIDVYGFKKADTELSQFKNIQLIDAPEEVYFSIAGRRKYEKKVLPNIIETKGYDITFYPSGTITGKIKGKAKSVTMFRNMLPFSKRDIAKFSSFKARLRYHVLRRLFLSSYKKANHVIFISNYAKSVIENYIKDIGKKSSVIVHGINEQFRLDDKAYNKDSYLLYVSIFNVYKHQKEIVEGLAQFKKEKGWAPKLKLVGFVKEDYLAELKALIQELNIEAEVELNGPATYDEQPDLYRNAKAVVFGSTCENCPNILLESMATGNPILCSNHQPLPEFLGEKGFYFDPEKPESFAKILNEVIENDEALIEEGKMAKIRSEQWTWEETAKKTLQVFESII